jgi:hypothetical protein
MCHSDGSEAGYRLSEGGCGPRRPYLVPPPIVLLPGKAVAVVALTDDATLTDIPRRQTYAH